MDKREAFKEFLRKRKDIAKIVIDGKSTYQKLYETYDIYGESSEVWDNLVSSFGFSARKVVDYLKKIDMDKLDQNVSNIEKALGFLEEIVTNKEAKKDIFKRGNNDGIERLFDE